MKWLLEQWHFWFVLVCVVAAFRNAYFHFAYEPLRAAPSPRIGSEFEPLRPLLVGSERIGYVTDEPLDADPALPREQGLADTCATLMLNMRLPRSYWHMRINRPRSC